MMRFLMIPALVVTALFAGMIGGLHLQPSFDVAHAACDSIAPCWQKFQPGVTSFDTTSALFAGTGWKLEVSYCQIYVSTCNSFQWHNPRQDDQKAVVFFDQGYVAAVWFINPDVTFGDLLLSFGTSSDTDEYVGFDLNGNGQPFTIYRSIWHTLASEVNINCPTSFAVLLHQPVHVLTVADPVEPLDPSLVLDHNFRDACLS
ncbi:MAG: hypothetical protein ABI700_23435 [Chloroflexota bacterium]